MDYDALEAGREMDALVAEKVMGFAITGRGRRLLFPNGKEATGFRSGAEVREYIAVIAPRYSTDIASAWEVAEKMDTFEVIKCKGEGYVACTGSPSYDENPWEIEAAALTAPLAICRAALKATESTVKAG